MPMKRFLASILAIAYALSMAAQSPAGTEILPGVWKFSFGTPDKITPVSVHETAPCAEAMASMGTPGSCPVVPSASISERGVLVRVPLGRNELIYGLGLQMQSFQQRNKKKLLRVNSDPSLDLGDSHAPVPFYVTTAGYGVFIDNARYMTYYLGGKNPEGETSDAVSIDIPRSKGVDVYVFAGPSMKEAVARYNLFSGGGPLPPRWGLGFWYRCETDFTQDQVLAFADEFRESGIPCDVIGLEPHWQTASYSCSYVWQKKTFPDPEGMLRQLKDKGIRANLWMHAYVHPTSPIHDALKPYSGNYRVWNGLVPDFTFREARDIFRAHHAKETTGIGVSGFKLDECDNSDYISSDWSFPEMSAFPSGLDGEQMHSLFGVLCQQTLQEINDATGMRSFNLIRSSGALAAPFSCVLYSDLYGHRSYINTIAQSGFSGLLWTPEVRQASSEEDFLRRMQTVMCSPLAMVNAWFLKMPPWKQMNRDLNNKLVIDERSPFLTAESKRWIEFRMSLIPYLHAAFVKYHQTGIPPFRALIMDYPDEEGAVKDIAGQYMMGDDIMVAPLTATGSEKTSAQIYFPAGVWYDFFTGERIEGGRSLKLEFPLDRMPVYVKEGTILPLARPTLSTEDPISRVLDFRVFGDSPRPASVYEDDGAVDAILKENVISWNAKRKKIIFKSAFYTAGNTEVL